MNVFEFDDRQVQICGKVYTIDFNQPAIGEYSDKVQAEIGKIKNGHKLTKKATDAFRDFIDLLLGKGAFDEIFSEQAVTITALTKLLNFLTGECLEEARIYKRMDRSDLEEFISASEAKITEI